LISEDDPITRYDNIGNLKKIVNDSENMVLLITKTGHHTLWLSTSEEKDSLSKFIVKFIKNLS
jgi:predicted alpha/beta-fold hydrolase